MRRKKRVLRLTHHTVALFLVCLYAYSRNLFPVWMEAGIFLLAFGMIGICLLGGRKLELSKVCMLYMATFIFVLMNNANLKNMEFRNIVEYLLIFLLFLSLRKENRWVDSLVSLLIFFGMIHAVATIALYFTPNFYRQNVVMLFDVSQQRELLSQYNHGWMPGIAPHYSTNGIYLGVGLGAAFVKAVEKKRRGKTFSYIALVVIFLALLMTGKRAHTLFGAAACCAVVVFHLDRKSILKAIKFILSIILILLAVYWISRYIPAVANVIDRFIQTSSAGDVTMGRGRLWSVAIALWKEHPIFGIGWDGFKYLAPALVGFFLNVHNVYIQLLCETGLIGAGVFYAFFMVAFLHSAKVIREFSTSLKTISYQEKLAASFCIYMQVFFLLYCVTGNPLYDAPVLFPYIFSCAITEYNYRCHCDKREVVLEGDEAVCV